MFSNNRSPSLSQQGFTLIEVMVALLIFMVIALGLAKGEIAALQIHRDNVFRDEALRLAEDEVSRLKGMEFTLTKTASVLNQTTWSNIEGLKVKMRGGNTDFARRFRATNVTASATELKLIEVAVGWDQCDISKITTQNPPGCNRQTTLSTIIAQSD